MNEARVSVRRTPASQLIAALPRRSVDLLVTDPPYRTVDRHAGGHLRRWFGRSLTWAEIATVVRLARGRLRPAGVVMVVVSEAGLPHAQASLRGAGFDRQRLVVWDQRRPGLGMALRHRVGYVVVGLQPASRTLAGTDLVAATSVAPAIKGRYPTEKPVALGRELAAIARIGQTDTVVDPFCGSGNLLVGAAERGARVIAGDVTARAVRLVTVRLTAASARGRPSLESPPSTARGAYRNSARRPAQRARRWR